MDSKSQCSSCSAETDGFLLVGTSCTCSDEKLAIVNATENLDMPEINFYRVLAFDFLLPCEIFLNCDMEFLGRYDAQYDIPCVSIKN